MNRKTERRTRFLLTGILFISSMYLMLGCTNDSRILGVWKPDCDPCGPYLTFAINGTLSVDSSDGSCSNSGRYLFASGGEFGADGGGLAVKMTDNDPPCYHFADTDFLFIVFDSPNEFAIGRGMTGSDTFCRTNGIGGSCIE